MLNIVKHLSSGILRYAHNDIRPLAEVRGSGVLAASGAPKRGEDAPQPHH